MALPIVVPEICMGVAMLIFFAKVMPWPNDLPWPFSSRRHHHRTRLVLFPLRRHGGARAPRLLQQGAGGSRPRSRRDRLEAFRDILIPHIKPALIAGALLSFTLSLDDFVITFFTSGPNTVTFPVKVYSMVRFSVTPEVNAASTMLIVITLIVMVAGMVYQNKSERK